VAKKTGEEKRNPAAVLITHSKRRDHQSGQYESSAAAKQKDGIPNTEGGLGKLEMNTSQTTQKAKKRQVRGVFALR